MVELLASVVVGVADGVRVRARVLGPEPGSTVAAGPFRIDRGRLPLAVLAAPDADATDASDLVKRWSRVRQVAVLDVPDAFAPTPDLLARWAFEALSRMGVTRADLLGVGACACAAVACMERDAPGRVGRVFRVTDEPLPAPALPAPTGIVPVGDLVVTDVGPDAEPQVQALYERMLDAEEAAQAERLARAPRDASHPVASGDTCGWRHGCWPLPRDVSSRLARGIGRACYRVDDVGRATPLSVMFVDHDMGYGFGDARPTWAEVPEREVVVPHLLATDPAARGTGAARALLADLVCRARECGVRVVRLNTSPENVAANELYRQCGFDLLEPTWLPYEGLPLTGWTNPFELWLDGKVGGR